MLSIFSMGPRLREDDVGLWFFDLDCLDFCAATWGQTPENQGPAPRYSCFARQIASGLPMYLP
jgi:hypothetical protein